MQSPAQTSQDFSISPNNLRNSVSNSVYPTKRILKNIVLYINLICESALYRNRVSSYLTKSCTIRLQQWLCLHRESSKMKLDSVNCSIITFLNCFVYFSLYESSLFYAATCRITKRTLKLSDTMRILNHSFVCDMCMILIWWVLKSL